MRLALLHPRRERPWDPRFQAALDELNRGTRAAVESLGWTGTFVPCAEVPVSVTREIAASADAVVILGGEDVDPRFYGGPAEYREAGRHEPAADAAQIAVVRDALATGQPLLGICRGHQLLNVALGGTLIQHLPTAMHHRGSGTGDAAYTSPQVTVDRFTGLERDVDSAEQPLCTHHQAIAKLGRGLKVAARASDGVIEAVVHASAPITGVQWHPEHPSVSLVQLTRLLRRLERQHLASRASRRIPPQPA
ncbi:MAG: gamma-glutamyl-gamma-aminobutyrate hydrolase family protein [Propionibacteriaceae bacterium]|nr:gamma-glutamyl-gamma-aminobutyrate hydrolase family protein [Propionibacteriaceae bacterium]